ncbi:MAG: class I SAM-dependent methyltransferase [Nitrospirae bacterium]|nr:class I SAM-dependent methyltransferase [Nitrospirota bacterium]
MADRITRDSGPANARSRGVRWDHERAFYDSRTLWFQELGASGLEGRLKGLAARTFDRAVALVDLDEIRGLRLLDLGCGDGRHASYFQEKAECLAIGVDVSLGHLRRGVAKSPRTVCGEDIEVAGGRTVQAAIEVLPFRSSSFDAAWLSQVFHHLSSPVDALQEARRVLRDGGKLFLVDPNGGHISRPIVNWVGRRTRLMSPDESAMDPDRIVQLLEENGFQVRRRCDHTLLSDFILYCAEVLALGSSRAAKGLLLMLHLTVKVDALADRFLLPRFPRWAWKSLLVAEKSPQRGPSSREEARGG